MKTFSVGLPVLALVVGFSANAAQDCSGLSGCEAKACQIEKQIEQAKQHGNENKEAGLKKALNKVQQHCSTGDLKSALLDDIEDVKDDMAEHKDDLAEAIQDRETDKIEKYKKKIAEDTQELQQLQDELKSL